MRQTSDRAPARDNLLLAGTVIAAAGFLLPWFKAGPDYSWWFSGWEYSRLSTGGGWTLIPLAFLAVAAGAGLAARHHPVAAVGGVVGIVGAGLSAAAVVAASFSTIPERDNLNYIPALPVGVGLPLMGIGFGLGLAGALQSLTHHALTRHALTSSSTPT